MIRKLFYADTSRLEKIINNKDRSYIKSIIKGNNIGYFQNNELKAYISLKKSNRYYGGETIYSINNYGYTNKVSIIKLMLGMHWAYNRMYLVLNNELNLELSEIVKINPSSFESIIDHKYKNKGIVKKETLFKLSRHTNRINCDIFIESLEYCRRISKIYMNLAYTYSAKFLYKYKSNIITRSCRYNLEILNEIDKKNTIKILTVKKKKLFNNGEKEYIKVLRKNGYKKFNKYEGFKDKRYLIEKLNVDSGYKPKANLMVYKVHNYSTKNFKYKNTLSYYRYVINIIKNFYADKSEIILLDSYEVPLLRIKGYQIMSAYSGMYYKYDGIILKYIILNGIYLEELEKYAEKRGVYFYKLNDIKFLILRIKKILGKQETTNFIKKYIKKLSKSKNYEIYYHDTMILYYQSIILSDVLTNKAKQILLYKEFYYVKKAADSIIKIINLDCMEISAYRKLISSYIKKDLSLEELYNKLNDSLLNIVFPNLNEDIKNKLKCFVDRMKIYCDINEIRFTRIFKDKYLDILNNKIDCIFNPYKYDNRQVVLGEYIKNLLKNNEIDGVKYNPKKIFTSINRIYDVKKIISGQCPTEKINDIELILKNRGINLPEEVFYYGKIEPKCSPEFLIAGNATNCCMGIGESKAMDYALEKGFGLINIYYKDRIISNSVIWINDVYNALVLDNIECVFKFIKKHRYIEDIYLKIIEYITYKYKLKYALQGKNFNDIKLFKGNSYAELMIDAKDVNVDFYTDAYNSYPIDRIYNPDYVLKDIELKNEEYIS